MNLLSNSSKCSDKGIATFGITAGKYCPNKKSCAKDGACFGMQGRFLMPNVKNAYKWRGEATKTKFFKGAMALEILKLQPKYFRIHDVGDFYNYEYLEKWVSIMREFPKVKFYAYTKMVWLVKFRLRRSNLKNFTPIYSFGGKEDHLIDVKKDRHSRVFRTKEELLKAGYVDASKDDLVAIGRKKKIGLVYHGHNKGRESFCGGN